MKNILANVVGVLVVLIVGAVVGAAFVMMF